VPEDPEEEHMSDEKSKKRAEYEGDEPDVEAHILDEADDGDTTSKKKKRSEDTGDHDFDRGKKKK
jgi:hypothetical protein